MGMHIDIAPKLSADPIHEESVSLILKSKSVPLVIRGFAGDVHPKPVPKMIYGCKERTIFLFILLPAAKAPPVAAKAARY